MAVGVMLVGMVIATTASAQGVQAAPVWQVTTLPIPTVLSPELGRKGEYEIVVENIGGKASSGPVTITDEMPAGLSTQLVVAEPEGEERACSEPSAGKIVCTFEESVVPSGFMFVAVEFHVTGPVGSGDLANRVSVSGGEASSVSNTEPAMRVAEHEHESAPPGISEFRQEATGPAGEVSTQAGGHPTFLTTRVLLNNDYDETIERPQQPVQAPKDLVFYLPLGMLGDPAITEPCPGSLIQLQGERSACPTSSRVGTIAPAVVGGFSADAKDPTSEHGIYSIAPEKGFPAEFAFGSNGLTFYLYASVVRHDGSYVLRIEMPGVTGFAGLVGFVATFYGDITETNLVAGKELTDDRGAFLTNPTDCQEGPAARNAEFQMNTWDQPEALLSETDPVFASLTNCQSLDFSSSIGVTPETTQAEAPSAYKIGLSFPQAPNGGSGLGTPPAKNVTVKLPAGTTISPSSANGLAACQETGPQGINIDGDESEALGQEGLMIPVAGHCPKASELGTVQATTPLLRNENLTGHLYLAAPKCGGAGQDACTPEDAENGGLFGLYIELEAPHAGVIIKLRGKASVDPVTGQIVAEFDDNPQFPLNDLTVAMKPGPRTPLANPQACGPAVTNAKITSWAEPYTPESTPSSVFTVDADGSGGACSSSMPFAPEVSAGTVNTLAGANNTFTLTLKREDREQNPSTIKTVLPEGLLANVASVAQCPEPQASTGGCPANSQVGSATVAVGPGSDPYWVTGQVYFTGPYNGAPFGLSIVVPAVAGPFNLGDVIVRVALSINPQTTQVTAQSGPIPQILDGVPLRDRTINITLNGVGGQANFTFNATSCTQQQVSTTVVSAQGAQATTMTPYATGGCRNLPFKPSLTASTQAKVSKVSGASLSVKVTSGAGQANIAKVDLALPKQLPSRLTTLQKACTEAQFNTNPAGCPEASDIGTAKAVTPILSTPLTGPAYLVSHGGAAFPDVEFVLQGENGVEIVLDGGTQIKNGITYSKFESVPDAPISSFETVLPEGPHSVLATDIPASAKNDLCGMSLTMPTTITGQNGAVITQTTKIAVTGCPKTKSLTRAQKLAVALRVCRKEKKKAKRTSCERQARKKYGPVKTKKKKK
jgi:hypothetical protein